MCISDALNDCHMHHFATSVLLHCKRFDKYAFINSSTHQNFGQYVMVSRVSEKVCEKAEDIAGNSSLHVLFAYILFSGEVQNSQIMCQKLRPTWQALRR